MIVDLKQHVNDDKEQTDCFETNFDILSQFCIFFYDRPKLIFVRLTKNQNEKMFWEVNKPFANFKTQLNHQ